MSSQYENLDGVLEVLTDAIRSEESQPAVMRVERMKQLRAAYDAFRRVVAGENITISYQTNKPYKSMGNISVEGDSLCILNPEVFHAVATLSDNMEVYPLKNGKVRLTFTFHGLTQSLM